MLEKAGWPANASGLCPAEVGVELHPRLKFQNIDRFCVNFLVLNKTVLYIHNCLNVSIILSLHGHVCMCDEPAISAMFKMARKSWMVWGHIAGRESKNEFAWLTWSAANLFESIRTGNSSAAVARIKITFHSL